MKVIFLDVDGVLNSFAGLVKRGGQSIMGIYQEHEEVLDWVLRHTDAKLVISSTWRLGYNLDQFQSSELFSYGLIANSVIDITPRLSGSFRGLEIDQWLKKNQETLGVDDFVILDDDSDMHPHMDHLIQTVGDYGLTYREGLMIVERLQESDYVKKEIWRMT